MLHVQTSYTAQQHVQKHSLLESDVRSLIYRRRLTAEIAAFVWETDWKIGGKL